jgi:hypothetical protein
MLRVNNYNNFVEIISLLPARAYALARAHDSLPSADLCEGCGGLHVNAAPLANLRANALL